MLSPCLGPNSESPSALEVKLRPSGSLIILFSAEACTQKSGHLRGGWAKVSSLHELMQAISPQTAQLQHPTGPRCSPPGVRDSSPHL